MGTIKWSDDQKKVISSRGSELLVSAAAGSGKTAVLVERIFQRIIDKRNPIDIDRFVVVTFTNAAAAQMKEKLRERIETALREGTDEATADRLRRQMSLLPAAHISTVHSFCNYIIGQYFHKIGIDPSMRQADETELKILKSEVAATLLEREYEEERDDFIRLAQIRGLIKNDRPLEEWIIGAYERVMSEPFTDLVLEKWESLLDMPLDTSPYLEYVLTETGRLAMGMSERITDIEKNIEEYPKKYVETFYELKALVEEINVITNLSDLQSDNNNVNLRHKNNDNKKETSGQYSIKAYEKEEQNRENINGFSYVEIYEKVRKKLDGASLSGVPKSKPSKEENQPYWAVLRPLIDRIISERDTFYFQDLEVHEEDRKNQALTCHTLIRLVREFIDDFSAAKREQGIVDFNDLEQYALQILFDRKNDGMPKKTIEYPARSAAARELSEYFSEIMIDEYQDSNRVQDTILWAVSDTEDGVTPPWESLSKNRFMVGDIKQSIYRFRNACPELFEQKMGTFQTDEGAEHKRIDLHQNFRSRETVLSATNEVFKRVMHTDIGGVEYDDAASLVAGRSCVSEDGEIKAPDTVDVEYFITSKAGDEKIASEARYIARKIREMVAGDAPLYIEKNGELKRVEYKDIVVLSRAVKGISQIYTDVFAEEGVPFVSELSQGFYGAREISLVTDFLRIIDNPRQDIPLAGVVLSPLFGITEEELSILRAQDTKSDLYEVIKKFGKSVSGKKKVDDNSIENNNKNTDINNGGNNEKATNNKIENTEQANVNISESNNKKITEFLNILDNLRAMSEICSTADLIGTIYEKTNIYDFFAALPDGARRCANLDYLMSQAIAFDAGGHRGAHAFIASLEKITEYGEDMGEASVLGEDENVVRLMTIHKSKGLEFPVVVLTRMASDAYRVDSDRFVYDSEFGMATFAYDMENGIKKHNIFRDSIIRKNLIDEQGEALRLLYVAMTRAEEKLVLVGTYDEPSEPSREVDFYSRSEMKTYMQMAAPAISECPDLFEKNITYDDDGSGEDAAGEKLKKDCILKDKFNNFDTTAIYNQSVNELLRALDEATEETEEPLPAKVSVSELKKASMEELEEDTVFLTEVEEEEEPVPAFARSMERTAETTSADSDQKTAVSGEEVTDGTNRMRSRALSGATFGTVWHQAMAYIDFEKVSSETEIESSLERLVTDGRLLAEEKEIVSPKKLYKFFTSDLGKGMTQAYAEGKLHREQPFTMSKPAREIYPGRTFETEEQGDTPILIQGIIDAYYETSEGIVLMDYKTDRLQPGEEERLIARYRTQLDLYSDVLETALGKKIIRRALYSFSLDEVIDIGG